MNESQATVRVTQFALCEVEDEGSDSSTMTVHVEYAGQGRWAVRWLSYCLGLDGEWEYEPIPSSRTHRWLDEHRFESASAAIAGARHILPTLELNGLTAAEINARNVRRKEAERIFWARGGK